MKKKLLTLLFISLTLTSLSASATEKAALPKGYEQWEKSMQKIVTDKKSLFYGIHYIYVNKKALKSYKEGKRKYPEGSRFVVAFYNIVDAGGKTVAGKKNMVVLMEKNRKNRETGGWLFAGFNPDGKPSGVDPVKNCFECHLKDAGETDLVISKYVDFK
ncbi:MAG: cytochrome P460 family protein [Geobacteraceae bacterium]